MTLPADYLTDVRVVCRTCDMEGSINNASTVHVQRLVRVHVLHDVTFDFTNTRRKKRARYAYQR